MKAKSIHGNSTIEIRNELEISIAEGFKPTLAVIFISIKQDIAAISSLFDEKDIAIFGATSAGEFTDQGITDGGLSVLLLDINPAYFKIILKEIGDHSISDISHQIGNEGKTAFNLPAFIISASRPDIISNDIVKGFFDAVGEDTTIIGGNAGDDLTFQGGTVFTNGQVAQQGIIALALDEDKIDVHGEAISGWKAAGTRKKVTKSEGAWVYSIDDQPALDMLLKFTGIKVNLDNDNSIYEQIGISYPFQVIREKGSPVMNPPIMFNKETRAVMCGNVVPQGSMIQFSLPPDLDVIETVVDSAREFKTKSIPEADGMIVFSCSARRSSLGPMISEEITGLKDIWNVPLAGFFTYGEFGTPPGGKADFHGTTCSWVVLKEK